MNLYGYEFVRESDLIHYGVQGMKWGVRRYQNLDGTATSEGLIRNRRSRRLDNRQAYTYGRDATIAARAHDYASQQVAKAEKRLSKHNSDRNMRKLELAKNMEKEWKSKESQTRKLVEKHYSDMVKKYGSSSMKAIKYDKNGRIDERVRKVGTYAKSAFLSGKSNVLANVLGMPIRRVYLPASKKQLGKSVYKKSVKNAKKGRSNENILKKVSGVKRYRTINFRGI